MALQHVERRAIAEEIGFVVEERFDDLFRQARLLAHDEDGDEFIEGRDSPLAQQRRQRGLDPPAATQGQLLPGARLQEARENPAGAVAYLHGESSSVREAIRRAILSGGRTAQASPASSMARGMPQTAQLASSWARIDPPQATRREAPSTPSRPIPVRTTPSAPVPNIAPTEASIGSTEGMHPLLLRPWVRRTTAVVRPGSRV